MAGRDVYSAPLIGENLSIEHNIFGKKTESECHQDDVRDLPCESSVIR